MKTFLTGLVVVMTATAARAAGPSCSRLAADFDLISRTANDAVGAAVQAQQEDRVQIQALQLAQTSILVALTKSMAAEATALAQRNAALAAAHHGITQALSAQLGAVQAAVAKTAAESKAHQQAQLTAMNILVQAEMGKKQANCAAGSAGVVATSPTTGTPSSGQSGSNYNPNTPPAQPGGYGAGPTYGSGTSGGGAPAGGGPLPSYVTSFTTLRAR